MKSAINHNSLFLLSQGLACTLIWIVCCAVVSTKTPAQGQKWIASWAASAHGPYPSGNPSAQPVLDFAFPSAATGAHDQTLRLMVRPDLWGKRGRLRFSNAFGTRPVTFDDVFVGLQSSAGNVATGTNTRVQFGGKPSITIELGAVIYLTDVRPQTVILDDVISALLQAVKQSTFVTINHSDFWHKLTANGTYCVICFKLSEERVRELPDRLRDVLRMPEWSTKRKRMGKVLLVSEQSLRWY